ncbi:dTDP-4-dehydrorhamnose 3,5-epimerase [Metallosphaera tengchongensis]|uniref:dTDP-4-dehydrorhamnose 3,5-epimerase n=1 Tax=Metallosphaera tengchongensis TaxID=1532350 RepID=A0A6N0NX75_9CREN|nr:dTDP-4-dehydrorhamnose 3,5-epimerase [Metallosphaera tengchongensis]QKR00837.1 dTDP-4-dehydrorhamnose 3,5-epimerase [Metallosphaera tengchongensis]
MPFTFKRLEVPEVVLVEARQFSDERGHFEELYKRSDFRGYVPCDFVQVNHSFSRRGVLRGLHFQLKPVPQGKLVSVVSGRIYDVAVDLRRGSPSYKRWVSAELTPGKLLWVPAGFAHGFLALEDSHVVYFVTREFSKEHDSGIRYDDPEVGVEWPRVEGLVLSEKDRGLPLLRDSKANFEYGDGLC